MATPQEQFEAFAQSEYLLLKGRYYDDLTSDDGQTYLRQVADWGNMFLDELETEVDENNQPLNWTWNIDPAHELGTAVSGAASIEVPSEIDYLVVGEQRYVQILQDGSPVSNWAVVNIAQISNKSDLITEDMCAVVGGNIVFSRAFKDYEDGGTIVGDCELPLPRLSVSPLNVKVFSIVKPLLLLRLGFAKNATLPDIVQGGLSPSYTQKYGDLLANAIARNTASSGSNMAKREQFGGIRGVGGI